MKNELTDKEPNEFFEICKHLSPWPISIKPSKLSPNKLVVTCFLQKGDKILALRRARKDAQYQLWGIPGGKLESHESPLKGLKREIYEETGAILSESDFIFLGAALSKTSTDGEYGLHLYHAEFPDNATLPLINKNEHSSYQWVTLDSFRNLPLLHAQKEAFQLVENKLLNIIKIRGLCVH